MKLFAVLDLKAGFFMQPFPEQNTVSALRGFEVAVNESKSTFSQFPDDFALMELASFDQQTGEIVPHAAPLNLGTGRSVLRPDTQIPLPFNKTSPQNEIRTQ